MGKATSDGAHFIHSQGPASIESSLSHAPPSHTAPTVRLVRPALAPPRDIQNLFVVVWAAAGASHASHAVGAGAGWWMETALLMACLSSPRGLFSRLVSPTSGASEAYVELRARTTSSTRRRRIRGRHNDGVTARTTSSTGGWRRPSGCSPTPSSIDLLAISSCATRRYALNRSTRYVHVNKSRHLAHAQRRTRRSGLVEMTQARRCRARTRMTSTIPLVTPSPRIISGACKELYRRDLCGPRTMPSRYQLPARIRSPRGR